MSLSRSCWLSLLLILSSPLAAECLHTEKQEFEHNKTDIATDAVTWRAVIVNSCRTPYDADLTIQFNADDGETVYEVRDLITVSPKGSEEAGKTIYVPGDVSGKIADMRIRIEERERPY